MLHVLFNAQIETLNLLGEPSASGQLHRRKTAGENVKKKPKTKLEDDTCKFSAASGFIKVL